MHQYLQPEDTVLELACGTGTLAIQIAGWVKEIQAIDISGKMVAAAEHKAAERAVTNIHFARIPRSSMPDIPKHHLTW